jgi:peptide-methionine (R)-S-oxide reductase
VEAVQQGNGAVAEALRPLLAARYPSQIYEALLEGLFLFCILGLVWLKPQKPGTIAGIFLSLYALVRIIGEQFRQPDLQLGFQLFGLTRGQWLSLCALLVGIVSTVFWIKRNVQRINGFNDLPSVIFLAPLAAVLILLAMIMPRPVLSSAATDLAGIPAHLLNIDADKVDWKSKDEAYWQSVLTADQFTICREAQTERPFSGKYCASKAQGEYRCACCGQLLFSSKTKFDSGSGWPSFGEAALPGAIVERPDLSHNMSRTEVLCSRCGAHLGHVFDDGPPPTHKRYCINSVCLYLQP